MACINRIQHNVMLINQFRSIIRNFSVFAERKEIENRREKEVRRNINIVDIL